MGKDNPQRAGERARAWYVNNTERAKARTKAWNEANPERKKQTDKDNYIANRGDRLAYAADPDRRATKAKRMRAAYAADPEGSRLKFRAWNYGLTVDAVRDLLSGGCCICGSKERLNVDHDHRCCPDGSSPRSCGKCVRGVLCSGCNTALGLIGESPERAEAIAMYLRLHNEQAELAA